MACSHTQFQVYGGGCYPCLNMDNEIDNHSASVSRVIIVQ